MLRLMRTASFRLAAAYAVVTGVTFIVLFALTYWIATEALDRQIRSGIEAEFANVLTDWRPGNRIGFAKELDDTILTRAGAPFYFFYADETGAKLAGNLNHADIVQGWRTSSFTGANLVRIDGSAEGDDDHQLIAAGKTLADGTYLMVGDDAFRVLSAQEAITNAFAWASLVAMTLSVALGLAVSQRFLRRIDRINLTTHAIVHGDLKERIPVSGTSDEIDRLAINLNLMLDNNHALMESLKQISASVAHDLRTPLSRLRQGLEDAKLSFQGQDRAAEIIEQAIGETDGILATFAALLRIAQVESGSRRAGFRQLNLSEIFNQVYSAYSAVAEDQGKFLSAAVEPGIGYFGDRDLLTQMLANLVENALRHTPPKTSIGMSLKRDNGSLLAQIRDSGPGIPVDQRPKVFERFYRLDKSRSTPGNGLGLTLVTAIAALHNIKIALQDNEPGLRVALMFEA